ncbi:tyrosine-protein kinase receptor TYRO3-like [Patiria miniata]|uniref:Protein kinase domain-containing protein n=1 Tax=Patiria miniata TaxID=46514 RepID=A0A914B660_PATMI|nr:tyrosine-protein kinase receptor TYRO3-like [Patiria miniata]
MSSEEETTNMTAGLPTATAMDTVAMTTAEPTTNGSFHVPFLWIIALSSVLGGLVVLLCIVACCWQLWKCYSKHFPKGNLRIPRPQFISEEDLTKSDFTISPQIFWEELKLDELALDDDMKKKMRMFLIPRNKLSIHKLIGEGQYAQVHFATLVSPSFSCEQKVAVKIMKEHWTDQARHLIEEGMLTVDLLHPNILTIIGISLEFVNSKQIRPLVVMPFLENGDLNSFLKNVRLANNQELSMRWRVDLMAQIASGMEFIASKNIVHRDLATRNCMLDDNYTVKVADFGLARQMHDAEFYKMKIRQSISCSLPVKWVAMEGLNDSIFTTMSDVWSFGVTMWEIFTHAKIPYPGLENYKVLRHLESGHRLYQPDGCPENLYKLMYSCWRKDPCMRPTFGYLREKLEALKVTLSTAEDTWSATIVRKNHGANIRQANALYHNAWV